MAMVGPSRGGRGGRRPGAGRKAASESPCITDLLSNVSSSLSAAHSFLLQHDLLLLPSQTLTLESLISSSSLSLSNLSSPPPPPPPPPSNCWFHRLLSSSHDPSWPELFRMSKPTFSLLFSLLKSHLPSTAFAAALFRLAHSASYSALASRFDISEAHACRAFYTLSKLICDHLAGLFHLRSDLDTIVLGFGCLSLPNCFGVLGSFKFPVSGNVFGSNGYLTVQALVDSQGRLLDVSAGWPGTVKQRVALAQTSLFNGVMESKELLNGPEFRLTDGSLVPQYVIGDSCYPLLPWLLTPYRNVLTSDQMVFNEVHSRGMRIFRKAFARIRRLWRLLDREWKEECVEFLPFVIVSCCLLYNFLIEHGEPLPDVDDDEPEVSETYDGDKESENEDAKRVRDAIALHLSRITQRI